MAALPPESDQTEQSQAEKRPFTAEREEPSTDRAGGSESTGGEKESRASSPQTSSPQPALNSLIKPTESTVAQENTGNEYRLTPDNSSAEDISLDVECSAGQKRLQGQKDDDDFSDLSVEMECEEDDDDDYDEDDVMEEENDVEEKGEGTPGEEEGETEIGEERKEEAEDGEEGLGGEEEEDHETDDIEKQKKSRMECRDCGKKFTRRETYNLHRHFHMHQEEQASLTCKECGLTFTHRSSLIKHRSEHKQNGVPHPVASRRLRRQRQYRQEMFIECDHCGERFVSVVRYRLHACQQNLEKPYRCPLCRKEFQYRVSINAHMQSHSVESPYRCLECNKGFQCALTLHIHQRSHAALKPYECPDCGMVFRHRSFMEDHRRRHTEERPHQCNICGKSFKYSSLLQHHQYLHTGQKPYRCSECGKRFAFAQNMRAHCRQHKEPTFHRPVADITNCDVSYKKDFETTGKENTNHNAENLRNCPLCPQVFSKAAELREHMLIHEAEYDKLSNGKNAAQVYSCSYCPLKFFDESTLQSHTLSHQVMSAPLKREVLSIARPGSIDNMSEGEWGDQTERKPLKCKDCGKCFRYRSVLELHMRIHNKGYQCHICKKSFRFSSYLQQHLIIHSGKKPFKCPDCGKDFAFLQNMKTHQRLHQQKPFRCTQCRKGYSDESQLQRHMLSHSGEKPHKCNICDKSFGLAYLLRDHLNTHTGERPHRCQECHKSFPWLSSLLVHQKIHARKRQALNQSYSLFAVSQRGRARGGRGKRNSKWISSWPRMQQSPFPGGILQGSSLPNLTGGLPVSDAGMLEQSFPLEQQWQVHIKTQLQHQQQPKWVSDGQPSDIKQQWQMGTHLKPILPKLAQLQQPQHNPTWSDAVPSGQVGPSPKQLSENCTTQDNGATALAPSMGINPIQLNAKNEEKQKQQPSFWVGSSTSFAKSPISADRSFKDMKTRSPASKTTSVVTQNTSAEQLGSSAKDNPLQEDIESDATIDSGDEQPPEQQVSGLDSSSHSTQTTEESSSKPRSLRPPKDTPKNKQEKPTNEMEAQQAQMHVVQNSLQQQQQLQLVLQPQPRMQLLQQPLQQIQQEQLQQQQFHQSKQPNQMPSAWDGTSPPNQLGTISIQFGAPRFAPGPGSTLWGFQAAPIVSQALINGPVQRPIRAQQQPSVVSGPQILLNQPSPFISPPPLPLPSPLALPGAHPIHAVAGQLSGAGPQGIFFTPQGIVSERPVVPPALTSMHIAQRAESLKPGSQVLFGQDRRFHCLVCGCTLPGELELQVHYMQHAQGEI